MKQLYNIKNIEMNIGDNDNQKWIKVEPIKLEYVFGEITDTWRCGKENRKE